eukprot:gene3057-2039_t
MREGCNASSLCLIHYLNFELRLAFGAGDKQIGCVAYLVCMQGKSNFW